MSSLIKPNLSFVLPCFNEQENIKVSFDELSKKTSELISRGLIFEKNNYIIYIDDGSNDNTWKEIKNLKSNFLKVQGIKLTKNFGHQSALLAGMEFSETDIVITIDSDLQDDLNIIDTMIKNYIKGDHIVYGVKMNRKGDSLLKSILAKIYYKLLLGMKVKLIENHADFRLVSRKVIDHLKKYKEYNLYLRGLFPEINSNYSIVKYDLQKRKFGKTKYSFSKMINLALNGITSLSTIPLRLIFISGLFISFVSSFLILFYLFQYFVFKNTVAGWTSVVLPIYFLGGIQLLGIGILSEYVSKLYFESKRRPRYLIDKIFK